MHSKSQVKWSGPLEPFAAGFDAELARLGYTPAGTRRKLEAAAHLSQWLAGRGMTADDIGDETIGEFAAARRAAGYSSQLTGQSLAWMLGYLRGLGAVRPATAPGPAAGAGRLMERFGAFLADERGLADKTRGGAHLDSARRFLAAAGPGPDENSGPLAERPRGLGRHRLPGRHGPHPGPGHHGEHREHAADVPDLAVCRRTDRGPARRDGAGARRRRIRMPALVTEAEAAALLAACDRTTAQGLRDYAIVLTPKRMGLRAREVAALTLEDVDWRSGIVHDQRERRPP